MEDERPSSIHELDSAPEAPDSSLVLDNVGPESIPQLNNNSPLRPYSPLNILNRSRTNSYDGSDHFRTPRHRFESDLEKLDQISERSHANHSANSGRRNRARSYSPLNILKKNLSNSQNESDNFSNASRKRLDSDQDRLDQISESSGANQSTRIIQRNSSEEEWAEFVEDDDGVAHIDSEQLDSANIETCFSTYLCGCIPVPSFCQYQSKWTRNIATSLVRNAPCFWFCCRRLEISATDRNILYRLNLLCAVFAFIGTLLATFVFLMLYWPDVEKKENAEKKNEETLVIVLNLWNINGFAFLYGIFAAFLFILEICTLPVIREVNLRASISYYWALTWLLPLQIFLTVGLFDFYYAIDVWVIHWWAVPSMTRYRKIFCIEDTFDNECRVPINGGSQYQNETNWCEDLHDGTNCTSIRDEAQQKMVFYSRIFFSSFGVCGIISIMLLILTMNVLSGIISRPIIQRSREANLPSWLSFPILACFAIAMLLYLYKFLPDQSTDARVLGVWYTVCGCLFLLSALLAWSSRSLKILNAQDKRNKHILIICFIILNAVNLIFIGFVLTYSILFMVDIIKTNANERRGEAACLLDNNVSCTCCEGCDPGNMCTEWSNEDVESVLQTICKSSATLGSILLIYAIGSLRYGFQMKNNISMYQIDYV